MAKKDDSELDVWRLRYPSAGVSWNLIGDQMSCLRFAGEAKAMLYQLKNRMNLAVPKLKSFQDKRSPVPGVTIIVKSIYGQDFIEISTGVGVGVGKEICSITFIDFPLYVPPMRNPGEIKAGEVQGVDYFKSYYSVDISKCRTCQVTSWEFLFRYLQSSPLDPLPMPPLPISTRIEWPIEPLHHHEYDANGLLLDHDGTDHTIYSLFPPAWGEIISHGSDSGGTFIIWKAYTESGAGAIYSRTGLAIMRLVARVKDERGVEICAQNERIEVDCCLKDEKHRAVEIWWEDFGTCMPYIIYGGKAICKMSSDVPVGGPTGLKAYTTPSYAARPLYAIPDIKGSCLPIEWTLSGPISFLNDSKKDDDLIYFQILGTGCNNAVNIKLEDRCGTEYIVRGRPCCEDAEVLSISYTSLVMGCAQQQNLAALGGCGPFTWAIVAGTGTIEQWGDGQYAIYTAPDLNANCTNNPTITVTDCCGNSAQIQLAINCYSTPSQAMIFCALTKTGSCICSECYDTHCSIASFPFEYASTQYDCNGDILEPPCTASGSAWAFYSPNADDCIPSPNCSGIPPNKTCTNDVCTDLIDGYTDCQAIPTCEDCSGVPCNTLTDKRSAAMKSGGCCPLNPFTGLPF
jgi:hypothetical protein